MKRKIIAAGLALTLLANLGGVTARAAAVPAESALATDDLTQYENGEVFVGYADGGFQVLAYETDSALAEGLRALAADETVTLIQPNYTYQSASADSLYAQQWALSNDGSFHMEERQNRYPVYDSPFSTPTAPGRWRMPTGFGQSSSTGTVPTRAAAGIDVNAEAAWALYEGKRDVVVALIDTGVDDSHGTHAVGTIAASRDNGVGIAGLASMGHVKIMALKALGGSDGSGSTASINEAVETVTVSGAAQGSSPSSPTGGVWRQGFWWFR